MSFRSNYKAHAFSREEVFNLAEKYVQQASLYNGFAFGDYVLNVIVPFKYLNKPLQTLDFNTLNLCFKSEKDRNNFIQKNDKIKINIQTHVSINCEFNVNFLTWNGKELRSINNLYPIQYLIRCTSFKVCHRLIEGNHTIPNFTVL